MKDRRDRFLPRFSFARPPKATEPPKPPPPAPAESAARPGEQPAAPQGDLRQWAGAPKATLAIAFTDIVSSVALGNKLGNRAMAAVRRAHFEKAAQLVRAHEGYLVKTIGDSVMAAFHGAVDALDFALAVHAEPGDRRVRIRVGIHVGPVSIEAEDVHGTTVNYAARVVSVPTGPEVWLSSEAKGHVDQERAPQHAALRWQQHDGLELKGFAGKRILWSVAGG